jgi:ribosomal-protein-serine acetyltransferase
MYYCKVNQRTELKSLKPADAQELFDLIDRNRSHLRTWHPWVDVVRSMGDIEIAIAAWQLQESQDAGIHAGIWYEGQLCGVINHMNVDWANRICALTYWLDSIHQGKGIMTECCRRFITHAFEEWKLNRITIECATGNLRSRAIPERLGFRIEGIIRSIEWLHDYYADHAIYGLLSSEFEADELKNSIKLNFNPKVNEPFLKSHVCGQEMLQPHVCSMN